MASRLAVVPPPRAPVYRVARGVDPFAPRSWEHAGPDGTFGNRFDDPGAGRGIPEHARFRAIYCATDRAAAFGETIARMRPSLTVLAGMADIEDDEPLTAALQGVVDPDDPARGIIPLEWRLQRRLGCTHLAPHLRFVDISSPETMEHLRRALAPLAVARGLADIDLSTITSQNRWFTQECARYVYEQVDDAGQPLYAGIRYLSRLNPDWECWAIFDTRMMHAPGPSETIHPDDPGLLTAAALLNLTVEGIHKGDYIRP